MREGDAATEILSSMSECANACAHLVSATGSLRDRRTALLDASSRFVEAVPLVELPEVRGPKDTIRRAGAVADTLKEAAIAWDGSFDPPDALLALAREFLACVGAP